MNKKQPVSDRILPRLIIFPFFSTVDPVRLSVNALASSLISFSKVPRSTSLHNSLPDLASPEQEDQRPLLNTNRGNSQFEAAGKSSGKGGRPPPLPPKSKSQSQSDESIDPLSSEATTANIGKKK